MTEPKNVTNDGTQKSTRGRRPLPEASRKVARSCRLRPDQWEKFAALGGTPWLEDMIEAAYKHLPAAQKESPPS